MFYRKQKAALAGFHPLHRQLAEQRTLAVTLPPGEWTGLLGGLAGHATVIRRRRWVLQPRMAATVVPLLRVLLADLRPGGHLGASVDLRGQTPEKTGPQAALPARRPITSLKQLIVWDPWLALRAELRDGSQVDVTIADRTRVRSIRKRNPRGKIKYKTKKKTVHVVSVTRRLPKDATLVRPPTPPPPWLNVRIKEGRRAVIRVRAKLAQAPDDAALTRQALVMATEAFRWTPGTQKAGTR